MIIGIRFPIRISSCQLRRHASLLSAVADSRAPTSCLKLVMSLFGSNDCRFLVHGKGNTYLYDQPRPRRAHLTSNVQIKLDQQPKYETTTNQLPNQNRAEGQRGAALRQTPSTPKPCQHFDSLLLTESSSNHTSKNTDSKN